jgi:hypothetical protein
MKGSEAPVGQPIRIGTVFEQKLDALLVVPVGLAQEHGSEAVRGELAAFDRIFIASLSKLSGE